MSAVRSPRELAENSLDGKPWFFEGNSALCYQYRQDE
jgi:hypothetical protein